ncbi:MAG TPA: GtrA family protein [Verrucomicrobiae bacterium]|nr:GtrA family protein [Verrucomicrobiae bacterium]
MIVKKIFDQFVVFSTKTQVGRFLVVGSGAFLVNVVLLYLFHGVMGIPILPAQILGAEGTIIFSFYLHHYWTYRQYSEKPLWLRFIEFNGSALGGSLISTLSVLICTQLLHVHYLAGLSIGAVLATSWNYFSNQYFIWTKGRKQQVEYAED